MPCVVLPRVSMHCFASLGHTFLAMVCFVIPMLSRSQEKLLRYLGTFPDALAKAWDVPRAVSLPGLSEAMGVVRSGLNQPLNALLDEGYIVVRVAHVLGGGSRRRQVYHITEKGWERIRETDSMELYFRFAEEKK